MVGKRVAIFTAIEVKDTRPGSRLMPEQRNFIEQVRESGGLAGEAQSVDEAMHIIGGRE